MSKMVNESLSGKDGKLLLGWEKVWGGVGEITLHVLAYHPRASKNKRKSGGFSSCTSGKIGLLICRLSLPKRITSGQTGSLYTGFQIWHDCNFRFLDKVSLC